MQGHCFLSRKKGSGSRFQYYLKRIFLPYEDMKYTYPVLQKWPVLLPVFWVVRWFKMLDPKKRAAARREIELERKTGEAEEKRASELMEHIGL